jgi:hypothetical protein
MTVNNFNWTLHALLFLHTQRVIEKQKAKRNNQQNSSNDSEEEEDVGIDIDKDE